MAGLFDTFTIATRGLSVQQQAINTTAHNISNANTDGYSRQRAVAETTKPLGGTSRFDNGSVGQVGTGAQITSIQRIRDSFLDYQVRNANGISSYYSTKDDTLTQVQNAFGEPSDTGIEELTTKFFSAFQQVALPQNSADVKTVAVQDAASLADSINNAYNNLQKMCTDTQSVLQNNVTDVNSYLNQINDLNKQIATVSEVGQTPNDLMDKRDNLLDQLSSKFGIQIDNKSLNAINVSSTEYPNTNLVKSDPNDINYNRFSYVKDAKVEADTSGSGGYKLTVEYYPLGNENAATKSYELTENDEDALNKIKDSLLQNRILIADKDGNAVLQTPATNGGASAAITLQPEVDVKTQTTSSGDLTITIGNSTITRDASGTITNTSGYSVTNNSDGTMYIKLSSDVTIEVGKDGSITTPAEYLKHTTNIDVEKTIFQTNKYDGRTDEAGNVINNVDNNNVKGDIAANQSVQATIKGYMDNLDRLAAGLAYSVNAIQNGSIDSSTASQGLQNNPIFVNSSNPTTDTGITAATIKVNSALVSDPTLINCNTSSTSGQDGARAKAIANLNVLQMNLTNVASTDDLTTMTRKQFLEKIGIDDTSGNGTGFSDTTDLNLKAGTNGSTLDSYYKTMINNIAVAKQETDTQSTNQDTILSGLQNQKAQVSGVSIDEETTNLIQFQHAYQANAKVISTIDSLLDVVINGLMK